MRERTRGRRSAPPVVRCLHLVRGTRSVRACARPSTPARTGKGCHCPGPRTGLMFCLRRPAIEPGTTWGVGHGTGDGHASRGRFEVGRSRIRFTSRITGSSASRPGGPSGRQQLIASSLIQRTNALRYRGAFSRPAQSPGQAERPGARRSRSGGRGAGPRAGRGRPGRPGRPPRVRVARDGPGEPVDVGRLERGDLARACGRGTCRIRPRAFARASSDGGGRTAEVADAVLDRAARSGSRPAAARDRPGCPAAAAGRPAARDAMGSRRDLVARPVGRAHVDPAGHRRCGLGLRRPASPRSGGPRRTAPRRRPRRDRRPSRRVRVSAA